MSSDRVSTFKPDVLTPDGLIRAALRDDEGALNKFRSEFHKLSELEKKQFVEDAHKVSVNTGSLWVDNQYIHNENYPETRVTNPEQQRAARLRATYDSDGTMIDFDVATVTTKKGSFYQNNNLREGLKIYDLLDTSTTPGTKIDEAQELENRVAPYAAAHSDMASAASLTDEGLPRSTQLWRAFKRSSQTSFETSEYKYQWLNDKETKLHYQHFLKTLNSTLPPNTLDEPMLSELYRQSINKDYYWHRASSQVIKDYNLTAPHLQHDIDIYNSARQMPLPPSLEAIVKPARELSEQFWRTAKIPPRSW